MENKGMGSFVRYLESIRDDVVGRHDSEVFGDGFNAAANLCVEVVSARMDDLLAVMKASGLNAEQQQIFAELSEMKVSIERRLSGYSADL
jgi:hypothetical protein